MIDRSTISLCSRALTFLQARPTLLQSTLGRLTAAQCTGISPACYASGSDSVDPIHLNLNVATLNATVKCRCILDLGLSCAVAGVDGSRDVTSDYTEWNWYFAAFWREAVGLLEADFNELTEAVLAIITFTSRLDELINV